MPKSRSPAPRYVVKARPRSPNAAQTRDKSPLRAPREERIMHRKGNNALSHGKGGSPAVPPNGRLLPLDRETPPGQDDTQHIFTVSELQSPNQGEYPSLTSRPSNPPPPHTGTPCKHRQRAEDKKKSQHASLLVWASPSPPTLLFFLLPLQNAAFLASLPFRSPCHHHCLHTPPPKHLKLRTTESLGFHRPGANGCAHGQQPLSQDRPPRPRL